MRYPLKIFMYSILVLSFLSIAGAQFVVQPNFAKYINFTIEGNDSYMAFNGVNTLLVNHTPFYALPVNPGEFSPYAIEGYHNSTFIANLTNDSTTSAMPDKTLVEVANSNINKLVYFYDHINGTITIVPPSNEWGKVYSVNTGGLAIVAVFPNVTLHLGVTKNVNNSISNNISYMYSYFNNSTAIDYLHNGLNTAASFHFWFNPYVAGYPTALGDIVNITGFDNPAPSFNMSILINPYNTPTIYSSSTRDIAFHDAKYFYTPSAQKLQNLGLLTSTLNATTAQPTAQFYVGTQNGNKYPIFVSPQLIYYANDSMANATTISGSPLPSYFSQKTTAMLSIFFPNDSNDDYLVYILPPYSTQLAEGNATNVTSPILQLNITPPSTKPAWLYTANVSVKNWNFVYNDTRNFTNPPAKGQPNIVAHSGYVLLTLPHYTNLGSSCGQFLPFYKNYTQYPLQFKNVICNATTAQYLISNRTYNDTLVIANNFSIMVNSTLSGSPHQASDLSISASANGIYPASDNVSIVKFLKQPNKNASVTAYYTGGGDAVINTYKYIAISKTFLNTHWIGAGNLNKNITSYLGSPLFLAINRYGHLITSPSGYGNFTTIAGFSLAQYILAQPNSASCFYTYMEDYNSTSSSSIGAYCPNGTPTFTSWSYDNVTINATTPYELLPYYTQNYTMTAFSAVSSSTSSTTSPPSIVVVPHGGALNLSVIGVTAANYSATMAYYNLTANVMLLGVAMPRYAIAIIAIIALLAAFVIGRDSDTAAILVFLGIMWFIGIFEIYLDVLALIGSLFFVYYELIYRKGRVHG